MKSFPNFPKYLPTAIRPKSLFEFSSRNIQFWQSPLTSVQPLELNSWLDKNKVFFKFLLFCVLTKMRKSSISFVRS